MVDVENKPYARSAPPVMRPWSAALTCESGASEHMGATSRRARVPLRPLSPVGQLAPGPQSDRVLRAEDPLAPGAAGQVGVDAQGVRVLRAEDPHAHGQRGEQVPGGGRVPRVPGPAGEPVSGGQGVRVVRAEDPLVEGSTSASWSRAAAASPASPVQAATFRREARVPGCSGPKTRSCTVRTSANRRRAAAGSPALPVQPARCPACRSAQGRAPARARAPARGAVGPVQPGPWMTAAQHGDLVPQYEQLGVLGGR